MGCCLAVPGTLRGALEERQLEVLGICKGQSLCRKNMAWGGGTWKERAHAAGGPKWGWDREAGGKEAVNVRLRTRRVSEVSCVGMVEADLGWEKLSLVAVLTAGWKGCVQERQGASQLF